MATIARSGNPVVIADAWWIGLNLLGTAVLAGAACLLPETAFYALLALLVALGAWQFLGLTHADDRLGRCLGVALALGHSATIWFFERNTRVLVPAQSLLPLSALFFTLLRPGQVASAGRRATGVAFAPLWIGLLTYLAVARRGGAEHGTAVALLALLTAALGNVGAWVSHQLVAASQPNPFAWPRLLTDAAGAIVLSVVGGIAVATCAPSALPVAHAIGFGAIAGGLTRVGRLGQAALETSFRGSNAPAPPKIWLLDHFSALLLTSALAYGYVQLLAALSA